MVINLYSGEFRRLLDDHPACMSEGTLIEIDGVSWNFAGVLPDVHSDGIALTPAAFYLSVLFRSDTYIFPRGCGEKPGFIASPGPLHYPR
ncbi:MAG: hypothetical protein KAR44_02110 [Candidatus Aegiribacteria sp.]|nr:hypothetical protein [Candidatus Aegiribacteria sp.]